MKTASQFAEKIKALSDDLDGTPAIVPVEEPPVVEEIADWRGPLQDIQVSLRRMIQQDIDKFMESAQKILADAEKSNWSKVAIQNSVARWSGDINRVYAHFKQSTKRFMDLVKAMGITTRRHSTKGKAPGQRGKMDWGKLSQVQLKKEIRDQVKRLSAGIHSLADDGSYMLHQIDRILKYKQPKDETVREEIGALYQDFVDFRNAFGSKVWGPYNGLIGRLNAVRDQPLGKYSPAYRSAMWKKPSRSKAAMQKAVGEDALPIDCPELREAIERDRIRATRGVLGEDQDEANALIEAIEGELLGEMDDDPEKGAASKMKAKGYNFKVLLKKGPPLYTKTEKGAKDVQKDYPGSKIVKNESGKIDDPAVIEAAEHGDLYDFFEDFDELLYGEDDGLAEGNSDDAPFPQAEAIEFEEDVEPGGDELIEKKFVVKADMRRVGGPSNYAGGWARHFGDRNKGIPVNAPNADAAVKKVADEKGLNPFYLMAESEELTEMSQVVKTIFQQLGGGRAMAMIGGQAMAIDGNTLGIKWPSRHRARIGNYVEITYVPGADLYDMEFFNVSMKGKKTVKKFKRLSADMLQDTFENHTHWYLRL